MVSKNNNLSLFFDDVYTNKVLLIVRVLLVMRENESETLIWLLNKNSLFSFSRFIPSLFYLR
jgi:hypothetical protein